jgi:hypothetical protein
MNPANKMAAKIETGERQSAGAVAGSDDQLDRLDKSDQQLLVSLKDLLRPNPHQKPAEDLHEVLLGISHHLDNEASERKAIYNRLLAEVKRRGSRGFAGYLVAICISVAATLAWLSYGEATKQIIATSAPELGWSPEAKQMIAGWVQQLGWTKLSAGRESTAARSSVRETPQAAPVAQTAPENAAPKAPAAPSIDPEQVHQIALGLAALQQTVEQLAAGQDQMAHVIDRLQSAVAEILIKIPEPPPPPLPIAAPARKPKPLAPPSSRALVPPYLPPHP